MGSYRSIAAALILTVIIHSSPSLGSVPGRKTARPRDNYVRISIENRDDFCIARPQDTVVYCASSIPRLCGNGSLNFTEKMVILQGPEGKCIGKMDGVFNGEARFDQSKILQRLPVLYGVMEFCRAYFENGKWIEFDERRRDDVFTAPSNAQPVSSTYHSNRAPWVRFNLRSKPMALCVGRNGSEEVFCALNTTDRSTCAGGGFVNFDFREVVYHRPLDSCSSQLYGYYDMLVDVKTRTELDRLPLYDKDLGEPCVAYGLVDGAQENPCSNDGRRCRP